MNLIENLKSLIRDERRITTQILEHLEMIEKRRLYFDLGYSSLYMFLRHECGYSEGQAYRRIEAMRITRGEPEMREKIKTGALNVSVLATASRFLKKSKAQKSQIIAQLENKSQKETLELFQKIDPERALKKRVTLELTPQQSEKLEQVRAMLSHQNPGLEFEGLLEKLCDEFLKRKMMKPQGVKSQHQKSAKTNLRTDSSLDRSGFKAPRSKNPRQIAPNARKLLFQNANHQCQHVHPTRKTRCPERRFLEVDDVQSVRHGATNQFQILRVRVGDWNRGVIVPARIVVFELQLIDY